MSKISHDSGDCMHFFTNRMLIHLAESKGSVFHVLNHFNFTSIFRHWAKVLFFICVLMFEKNYSLLLGLPVYSSIWKEIFEKEQFISVWNVKFLTTGGYWSKIILSLLDRRKQDESSQMEIQIYKCSKLHAQVELLWNILKFFVLALNWSWF